MHDHAADSGQGGLSELSIFVGNLIAEGHDDASIIRQLEARGFTQETAHRLLSVVRAKAETPVYVAPEPVTASALPGALIGGAVAAIVGGAAWGLITAITRWEIGYVAWGIGLLAGFGVVMGSGGRRGTPLQLVAVASAVLGILIGKYFTFFQALKEWVAEEQGAEVAAELTMISVSGFQFFLGNIGVMLSGFDAIWVLLAVGTAWGIPKLNSEH